MSDLLVIKFDGAQTADEALASVRGVERGGGFGLTDTAVVSKNQAGELRVKNEWSTGAETGAVVGGLLGAMVSFMFPPAGAAVGAGLGALVGSKFDTGVDQGFVKDVSEALKPDTSALFLMIKSGGDAAAIVSAFRPFKGTVYQTTLSPDFESSLQRALSGRASRPESAASRRREETAAMGQRVTVLGGGNTDFSIAANLALAGHDVLLWEHPDFAAAIAPIAETRTIHLDGTARTGPARLAGVTTDAGQALAWSETLVCSVPAYAHAPFAAQLAPHLRPGHLLVLGRATSAASPSPRRCGTPAPTRSSSPKRTPAPYVCRKLGPDRAVIWGTVSRLGVGVYPASQTDEAMPTIRALFPGASAYGDVLEAGLSALDPIVHPPGVLLNAGRIERSRGEFWFYEEGMTPGVARTVEALDAERLQLGEALGLRLTPVGEAFHAAGFGPAGDLWAVINGSRMLTALRAPARSTPAG